MNDRPARKFGANNGRVVGWLAMIVGIVTIGLVISDGIGSGDVAAVAVVGLVMLLIWSIMLRPTIIHDGNHLVLRQPFSDVRIPLVEVDSVTVRLFTLISTPQRQYHSSAFSRSRRQLIKRDTGRVEADPSKSQVDLVEEQLNILVRDARVQDLPTGPVTRTPAWIEIGGLVALLVVAVVLIAL